MSEQKDKINIIKTVSAEQNKKLTKQKTKEVYAGERWAGGISNQTGGKWAGKWAVGWWVGEVNSK